MIEVDIEFLDSFPFKEGNFVQILGEISVVEMGSRLSLLVKSRVMRNIDGVDLSLFDKVLTQKRMFMSCWESRMEQEEEEAAAAAKKKAKQG